MTYGKVIELFLVNGTADSSIPIICFFIGLVVPNMLFKSFLNILGFSNIHRIRSIVLFTKQEINARFSNIVIIARRKFNTRNLNCHSIPI